MREVEVLEERLREVKKALEESGEAAQGERALLRQVVGERIQRDQSPSPPMHAPLPATPSRGARPHDEVEEVRPYVELALEKDISAAVEEIRKTGNAHLLDAFHDAVVDKFYEILLRAGKISPE